MDAIITLSQLYPAVFYSLVFFVSLMVGSFLNVVIYRLPIMMERSWHQEYQSYFSESEPTPNDKNSSAKEEVFNLVKPDSTCPSCGHKIRAWENVPVISYLFLKGKCAKCKVGISVRYPLVELFTALACTFAAYQFGVTSQALWDVLFTYILVALL
ncbi:MAG TPA: prepilin peptidase, partial [Alteromonas macleodii]|nr:prepilin peptidase [Alteromonas macleodii]